MHFKKHNKILTSEKSLQKYISIEVIQDYASHYLKTFWQTILKRNKDDTTTTNTHNPDISATDDQVEGEQESNTLYNT